ncbi:DyP-type peroxidase [Auricularia subglabra TFB-10046 SS5]|nr:DyP-type peroxidase [Auricularia subglabra TFB-10046 SS5]
MFKNLAGLPPVPNAQQVSAAALPVDDIQGDILIGMHKLQQLFVFFGINDPATFKTHLANDIAPIVASSAQLANVSTQPLVALNIAFSQSGLTALGVTDNLGDAAFSAGQVNDINNLGETTDTWVPAFVGTSVHGVILLASDDQSLIDQQVGFLDSLFGSSITTLHTLEGSVRPGAEAGHEPFGFVDGIAQPALNGFHDPLPGQIVVDPGVIIVGGTNDAIARPSWATGGSFLVFRELQQLVPEFNKFMLDNAPPFEGKTLAQRAALFGARIVGRWKSGAPIDLAPLDDDPALGADPQRNNNFDFTHPGSDITSDQSHCPFSAHIRKVRPRADLNGAAPANTILRSGIPFGPEVSDDEAASNTTTQLRGLAFVAYQAQIARGFQFLQRAWSNNPNFPPRKSVSPGFDVIIGQNKSAVRTTVGLDVNKPTASISVPQQFVVSRGGEYFFSPPISALTSILVA